MVDDYDRGEPTCFNNEYHDWTHVEAGEGKPAYNYRATCGYREVVESETADTNG